MKKLISTFALLCTTSLAFAGDYPCCYLYIKIKNNTPFTCHLVQYALTHGGSEDYSHMPLVIQSGMESASYEVHEAFNYGPTIDLTYECGEGKKITIRSKQPLCRSSTGSTKGSIVSAENMDAIAQVTNSSYWNNLPGSIDWILN